MLEDWFIRQIYWCISRSTSIYPSMLPMLFYQTFDLFWCLRFDSVLDSSVYTSDTQILKHSTIQAFKHSNIQRYLCVVGVEEGLVHPTHALRFKHSNNQRLVIGRFEGKGGSDFAPMYHPPRYHHTSLCPRFEQKGITRACTFHPSPLNSYRKRESYTNGTTRPETAEKREETYTSRPTIFRLSSPTLNTCALMPVHER